jgi:MFS family permease
MAELQRAIRWNTLVLAAAMALAWTVIQLMAGLAAVIMTQISGVAALAGFAPGAYLAGLAVGGLVTGRAMDAWGRRNGLLLAFLLGAAGTAIIYVGVTQGSLPVFVLGLVVTGFGTGGANLARTAGADMHPPERRARGIALILVGAAFGAVGSPLLFAPLLAGARGHDPAALALPWPIAGGVMLVGAALLLAIRVDPREIAARLRAAAAAGPAGMDHAEAQNARPITQLLLLPLVPLALLAAVVSQAVMTATMALVGLVLVDHGHDLGSVSITISIHFLGMFGLVLVVGRLVDRIGRFLSVLVGLAVLAGGVLLMLPGVALLNILPAMFAVGVGWNIAFVASTAILADVARPTERGRLLGFSDSLSIVCAGVLSIGGGLIVGTVGLPALVVVGVLLAAIPTVLIGLNRRRLEGVTTVVARG